MSEPQSPSDYVLMSQFISHQEYARFEHLHPGWLGAVQVAARTLRAFFNDKRQFRVLEFGCGPGTSTCELVRQFREDSDGAAVSVDAIDNDPNSISLLQRRASALGYSEISAVLADDVASLSGPKRDAFLSVFALSHLRPNAQAALLKRVHQLTECGFGIVADEFIPTGVPLEEAYWTHHSAVIFDALIKGNLELARLELEALHSGVHGIGDFKVSIQEFECALENAELMWFRVRLFPLTHHLVPSRYSSEPLERRAQSIWEEGSKRLRNAVKQPPGSRSLFPQERAYSILDDIFSALSNGGCDRLRSTEIETSLDIGTLSFDSTEAGTEEFAGSGVFAYIFVAAEWSMRLSRALAKRIV
jgi:SAM-dependent methyltransferase